MFVTMEEVQEYVAARLSKLGVTSFAAGTVVTSPANISTDPLTVAIDPSALATPVKALQGVPVLPGMRVVLGLVGADPRQAEWACLGPYTGDPVSPPSSNSICDAAVTSLTDTTGSATYVDLAGAGAVTSFPFTKRCAATRVKIELHASLFVAGTGNSAVRFGVQIGGTDYDIVNRHINPASTHAQASGTRHIESIPPGVYTVQGRWRRSAGTQTLTRGTDNWLSISAEEVT